jgi:hypothetical protein
MKKFIFIITLVSIASALFANIAQSKSINVNEFITSEAQINSTSKLPATIKDAMLLNAWQYLYSQTQPIQMWDGSSLTGQQLAQLVIDERISIVWDTKNVCNGYNCAPRSICADANCNAKDYPVYMALYAKEEITKNIASLAALMGHEIYHHSEPFGKVADTQFEEYWAYTIQSNIENSAWKNEVQKDTLNRHCLRQWFVDHKMTHYLDQTAYPQSISSQMKSSAAYCPSPYSK